MNWKLGLATATALSLGACNVAQTDNQAASAETNAAGENAFNAATADGATAAPAAAPAAAPDEHQYGPAPDSLPPGAQLAVLHGNPAEPGMFIIRLRFPAGYSVPAHSHPTTEYVTVIAGNMSLGMGDRLDRSAAKAFGPGRFVIAPGKMNHYAFTDQGATIQISAEGPFAVTYVNPADDPRRKTAG